MPRISALNANRPSQRGPLQELADDTLSFLITDALSNIFCPACKLWNTGVGATMMREAVSLMGGYGITEDCPGFLGQKWMDSQLEATYEGPEAVQRRQLSVTMANEIFLAVPPVDQGYARIAAAGNRSLHPGKRHGTLALTLGFLQKSGHDGKSLPFIAARGGFPFVDALCWLLTSRQQTDLLS
jgi:hypothetical protein